MSLPTAGHHLEVVEKILIALALLCLSLLLYGLTFLLFGDLPTIQKYFLLHLGFLPIHALVLTIIFEELLKFREKTGRRRRLNVFLGVFFRQMGADLYVRMLSLLDNRDELDRLSLVQPDWTRRDFRQARQQLGQFRPAIGQDPARLSELMTHLVEREREVVEMTRNPHLWEFENFYRTIVALFHLIEEAHLHGDPAQMSPWVRQHLGQDVGQAMLMLLKLWLMYLEYLKHEHPVLFRFKMGLHNTVQPLIVEEDWEE
ncbi:MAG: hypothetical protein V1797_12160 [Pseudomonadota bacterium]